MRGPAEYEATLVREWCVERTARELGIDSLELRLQSLLVGSDFPYRHPFEPGIYAAELSSGAFRDVAEQFLVDSDFRRRKSDSRARRRGGELAGTGIAMYCVHSGYGINESLDLCLRPRTARSA